MAGTVERSARPLGLVLVGCLALVIAGCSTPAPHPAPSRTAAPSPTRAAEKAAATAAELEDAVFARLPTGARSAPSFTYTDTIPTPSATSLDSDGKTLLLAAACDGGGTLTITVTGRRDRVLQCSTLHSAGPINISAAVSLDAPSGVEFGVKPSAGSPRYYARAAEFDSAKISSGN